MKTLSTAAVSILAVAFCFGLAGPLTALAAGPAAVNLLSADNFVILSKTGISTTGATSIVGDIGVSPAEATYITGFALTLPAAGAFSTSALITGKVYAPSYALPTPTYVSTAVSDMQTAYTDAAGRTNPTATELGAGNIGGMTLAPGLYKWSTGVTIPTDVTLSGGVNDVWIFQVAQNLNLSSATKIILAGGAQANNVFWVVAGQTTIGTTAVFNGNILDQTAIVLNTGATLNGRALAQSAVTLDASSVSLPSGSSVIVTPVTPVTPVVSATPASGTTNTSSTGVNTSVTSATSATPATKAALQAQLNGLLTQLQSLQAAQGGQQIKTIAVGLAQGSRNNDVATLQQFLISQNKGPAAQALANTGVTAYFGGLTRSALAEFQAKVGISPALGNFGAITRAYVSAHY